MDLELMTLARRRYPHLEIFLALECFLNDRRVAGLGALDEVKRGLFRLSTMQRCKRRDQESGRVYWVMGTHRPTRIVESPMDLSTHRPSFDEILLHAQRRRILGEVHLGMNVMAYAHELRDQRGRRMVARRLRAARSRLRKMLEAEELKASC